MYGGFVAIGSRSICLINKTFNKYIRKKNKGNYFLCGLPF